MSDQRRSVFTGALVGLVLTAPLLGLLYLGRQLAELPMVAFDLFERLTRIPQLGPLVSKSIDVMVSVFSKVPGVAIDQASKTFEQFSALALFLVLGAIVGAIYGRARGSMNRNGGLVVGLMAWVLALVVEFGGASAHFLLDVAWLAVVFVIWGVALAWVTERLLTPVSAGATPSTAVDTGRRQFLIQFGGSALVLTAAAFGLGKLLGRSTPSSAGEAIASLVTPSAPAATEAATQAGTSAATAAFTVAPGTRPEITPNDQFYRVDVNVEAAPMVDEKTWKLSVGGLVNTPLSLSYQDVLKMPPTQQYATLECISNPVGGDLISTTQWTGIKLRDVLTQAGLKDGVTEIKFTCTDGYTESLPLESAMDERTLLTYAMNGKALAAAHGFPMRLYTPNRYGMKNPKWITTIEAINSAYDGYWETDGGWNKEAIVKSTSVIDNVATDQAASGAIPVGGIAFAGARGISKVELSVDNGPWQEAQLKQPVSPLTWVLWRFDWKGAAKGSHNLTVRTVDGGGQPQIQTEAPLHPDGASGYFNTNASV